MKTAACALILGCVAYAEEPCLTTVGTSLEAVSVRATRPRKTPRLRPPRIPL